MPDLLHMRRMLPRGLRVAAVRHRRLAYAVSGALAAASLVLFATLGLNYGIDFRGGVILEVATPGEANIADLRESLGTLNLGDIQIQRFGAPRDVLIRVEAQDATAQTANRNNLAAVEAIRAALGADVEYRRVEVVGPRVSSELVRAGVLAIVAAIGLVLVYIWLRFEWQFSAGAILALTHDIVLTIGIFSLLRIEFTLSVIAALLTIVGYSLNDTVVVYDRVRENLRKYKKMPIADLLDLSISQTLSRTLMTSMTTLLALGALYILGGEVLRGFTFAMIWGVVVGTYSSVFIASPLLLILGVKREWGATAAR